VYDDRERKKGRERERKGEYLSENDDNDDDDEYDDLKWLMYSFTLVVL